MCPRAAKTSANIAGSRSPTYDLKSARKLPTGIILGDDGISADIFVEDARNVKRMHVSKWRDFDYIWADWLIIEEPLDLMTKQH